MSTKVQVTYAGVFADGSFGLSAKKAGDLIGVWFCNRGFRSRNGHYQDKCAHKSRKEALACVRHVGKAGEAA